MALEPMALDRETRIRVNLGTTTERVPISCAVEKPKYIESRKEVIENMNKEIKRLEAKIAGFADATCSEYMAAVKRLAKCRVIKQNCEFSIKLTTEQMGIEKRTYARTR